MNGDQHMPQLERWLTSMLAQISYWMSEMEGEIVTIILIILRVLLVLFGFYCFTLIVRVLFKWIFDTAWAEQHARRRIKKAALGKNTPKHLSEAIAILNDGWRIGSPFEVLLDYSNHMRYNYNDWDMETNMMNRDMMTQWTQMIPEERYLYPFLTTRRSLLATLGVSLRTELQMVYPPQGAIRDPATISCLMKRATGLYREFKKEAEKYVEDHTQGWEDMDVNMQNRLKRAMSFRKEDWNRASKIAVELFFMPTTYDAAFESNWRTSSFREKLASRSGQLQSWSGWVKYYIFGKLDSDPTTRTP
nr:hypothetical protein [Tolivirales sp.]